MERNTIPPRKKRKATRSATSARADIGFKSYQRGRDKIFRDMRPHCAKHKRITAVEAIRGIDNDGELVDPHDSIRALARENKSLYLQIRKLNKVIDKLAYAYKR